MQKKHLWPVGLWLVTAMTPHLLAAQSGTRSVPHASTPSGVPGAAHDPFGELDSPEMQLRMQNARKNEQRKRIVDNANRLLETVRQLRQELQSRNLTADDERRLDEIAKLARQVKDQMAGR